MQKIVSILLLLFIFLFENKSVGQLRQHLDSFCVLCNRASSDSEKVDKLGKLAGYFYMFKLSRQADSVLQQQLLIAQLSDNKNLILNTFFGPAILNMGTSVEKGDFDNALQFLDKGIDYARTNNEFDYLAAGYARKADLLRKCGKTDPALANAVLALSALESVSSDSIRAVCYISLGDIYLEKKDAVTACRNYNNAFDVALKINSVPLQSKVYHCLSKMYKQLGDNKQATEELNKSYNLNRKFGNREGLVLDYYDLATVSDEKYFIEQAIDLADSLKSYGSLLNAKRLMLVYLYVIEKDAPKALAYLESEPDLKESFVNNGRGNYLQMIGNLYFWSGHPDSALQYYRKAKAEIMAKNDDKSSMIILTQVADSYFKLKEVDSALRFYAQARDLSIRIDDAQQKASITESMSNCFSLKSDFKHAYAYMKESRHLSDSLKLLAAPSDITLLKVDRENKKHEMELQQIARMENNKRNLQYMAITVALVIVFFIMLLIGSFSVSKTTVRLFGYFFFISLFEFIVLLIDNLFLTHATHNQPLKIWLIKIGLIGLLAPFQHYLETNMISLLASKRLIEARSKLSLKKYWDRITKPSLKSEEGLEKDTAVM